MSQDLREGEGLTVVGLGVLVHGYDESKPAYIDSKDIRTPQSPEETEGA